MSEALELFSTDDLLDELARRSKLFVCMMEHHDERGSRIKWAGPTGYEVVGFIEIMKDRVKGEASA